MHCHAKDPASCYSHFLGVVLSITGLVTLLVESRGDPWRVVGFSIYGASLILLYSASTIYHWQALPPRGEDILKRLDHVAIFVLIAGTYTPVCLVTLRGGWGWSVLGHRRIGARDRCENRHMIAGTYTPVCLVTLRGGWGWSVTRHTGV